VQPGATGPGTVRPVASNRAFASRLSEPGRRRYYRRARTMSASIGVVVVVGVWLGVAGWMSQIVSIDLADVVNFPAGLGFTMWSGHPMRGHPGATAPLVAEAPSPAVCTPEHVAFVYGLADLKFRLGEPMGEALECERAVDEQGNTVQLTTTGLAAYDQHTQTVTFTDGWRHWALAQGRLLSWEGDLAAPPRPPAGR
jgi:hypothetical protein